jgi:hypothetical protein
VGPNQQDFLMKYIFGAAFALTTALSTAAFAAPQHERVRGTVSSISSTTLVVQTASGADISVALTGNTHYLQVAKADLTNIPTGDFIGTATKSVGSLMVALEVVIFPPSMAGTGEGHYVWDKLPDTTRAGGAATASSMTNGTVTAVKVSAPTTVNSSMTNGTVAAATSQNGAQQLTVTYKGGQKTILVPPTAPIVTFHPGDMTEVTKGAAVFVNGVKDGDGVTANVVAVGVDGVRPPM